MRVSKPKLVFFDVDGTLVNSTGGISDKTRESVGILRQQGIGISLATGRAYFGCHDICESLSIDSPSVFFSGALIINPLSGRIIKQSTLPTDAIHACLD